MVIYDYHSYDTIEDDERFHEIGRLQLGFLVEKGLKPYHRLLDVGCGVLRGGAYLIEYLNEYGYMGIDGHRPTLDMARRRIEDLGLSVKRPRLMLTSTFEFEKLSQKYDYALAQSVFTHLRDREILLCLRNMRGALVDGGRFYASFFEGGEDSTLRSRGLRREMYTHRNKNPFHQPLGFYEDNLPAGLRLNYIGEWGHPRGVGMLEFVKEREENGVRVSQ